MVVIPTVRKSTVTSPSWQGGALCPALVMGERATAPKAAASAVVAQSTYVPYSALQYAASFSRGESRTSAHTPPNATRKVPFGGDVSCTAEGGGATRASR